MATCTSSGPDRLGREHAEPATFDHRGAAHADVRALRGDDHVAAAEDGGVAGEAPARGDADDGHEPGQPAPQREGEAVEPRHPGAVGVARSAAAAFGEEHDRQPLPLDDLEEAVLLAVVLQPLRAGEDGVVVRQHRRRVAVDGADAGDEAVGRRPGDEVVELPTSPLRCDHQRAVLDEAARVDEVVDVLAGRALPGAAASLDRIGTCLVEADGVSLEHLGEVGPRSAAVRVGVLDRVDGDDARFDDRQHRVGLHGVAGGDPHIGDVTLDAGLDRVLHLHRLDDDDGRRRHRPRCPRRARARPSR